MENIQSSKDFGRNLEKITLKGYYQNLPKRVSPKQQMLEEIQNECENLSGDRPTMVTVRNWVLYGLKPKNVKHIDAIVKVTGIAEEDLWED